MFVIKNVYLLLKISKLFVKSINLLRNGEKTGDRCQCSVNYLDDVYHQYYSTVHAITCRLNGFFGICYTSEVGNIHA